MPSLFIRQAQPGLQTGLWQIAEDEAFFHAPAARQIPHPQKRLQHLAARHLLQTMAPDFAWDRLYRMGEKPVFPGHEPAFSVSHCGDYAAAALLVKGSVGIDVELVTERMHRLKHKFLHPTEQRWVNSFPQPAQARLLTQIWSAKEALFKWWGHGNVDFSQHLRIMPFELTQTATAHAAFLHPLHEAALLMQFEFFPAHNLVMSCVSSPDHP